MNWTELETPGLEPEYAECFGNPGAGAARGLNCGTCPGSAGCRSLSEFDRHARIVESREEKLLWESTNRKPELEYR